MGSQWSCIVPLIGYVTLVDYNSIWKCERLLNIIYIYYIFICISISIYISICICISISISICVCVIGSLYLPQTKKRKPHLINMLYIVRLWDWVITPVLGTKKFIMVLSEAIGISFFYEFLFWGVEYYIWWGMSSSSIATWRKRNYVFIVQKLFQQNYQTH